MEAASKICYDHDGRGFSQNQAIYLTIRMDFIVYNITRNII